MKQAFLIQSTSPAEERWKIWRKECGGALFTMECFTEKEAKALRLVNITSILFIFLTNSHSKISNYDVKNFLANFKKWGPNIHTCIRLAEGVITTKELQTQAAEVARRFAQDPDAINMQAISQESSHVLFTVTSNDVSRSSFSLRVTNPYLCGLVMKEITLLNETAQASFYQKTSTLPAFKGTWGYMFEKYFLVWLHSTKQGNELECTAKSPKRKRGEQSNSDPEPKELSLQPVGPNKLIKGEISKFGKVKDSDTPFGWLPSSLTFPSFDAVICTHDRIITIQLTVSHSHSMDDDGFKQLKKNLPANFQKKRTWCHVFVTDREGNANSLLKQYHDVAAERNISIYSVVLDVPACKFSSEDVERTFTPNVCLLKATLY